MPPRSQTFDSAGPEGRVRGNAHQVYEKYLALARDATASGDRIAAEGFYQFAEHYYRVVNDSTDPHFDGQRRFDQGREGAAPRGEALAAGEGGSAPQFRAPRGNGAATEGEEEAREKPAGRPAQAAVEGPEASSEQAAEAAPRRRGLRRRRPASGNGAAQSDEDGGAQDQASSESDEDVVCP